MGLDFETVHAEIPTKYSNVSHYELTKATLQSAIQAALAGSSRHPGQNSGEQGQAGGSASEKSGEGSLSLSSHHSQEKMVPHLVQRLYTPHSPRGKWITTMAFKIATKEETKALFGNGRILFGVKPPASYLAKLAEKKAGLQKPVNGTNPLDREDVSIRPSLLPNEVPRNLEEW